MLYKYRVEYTPKSWPSGIFIIIIIIFIIFLNLTICLSSNRISHILHGIWVEGQGGGGGGGSLEKLLIYHVESF